MAKQVSSGKMPAIRYAIYFVPAQSSLHWAMGTRWLGRDPITGERLVQPHVPGLTAQRVRELTAAARRYGLHATLKPPFRLRSSKSLAALDASIKAVAHGLEAFDFPLSVDMLSGFIAWRPNTAISNPAFNTVVRLNAIAATCVEEFDEYRALADMAELAKRRGLGLTGRQEPLLQRWGYPYVMEEFRFHLTLTDRLPALEQNILLPYLQEANAALAVQHLRFDALHLFVEPMPNADFLLAARYSFDGEAQYFPAWQLVA